MSVVTRERWRGLLGNPNYFVSSHGRVRGPRGDLLRPYTSPSGHQQVAIAEAGRNKSVFVHVLVLMTFVGPPPPGQECLHGDGVPSNNRLTNLRWGTRLENLDDLYSHTDKSPRAHLTRTTAKEIRAKYDGKRGAVGRLANAYGVSNNVIYGIVSGKTYKEAQ